MTKPYNTYFDCQYCGKRTTMETEFLRWMRHHSLLDPREGIVRTDMDQIILRYKTHKQGRKYQLMIILEIKDYWAEPDPAQKDMLSFLHQMAMKTSRNMYGAVTYCVYKLKSWFSADKVRVRFLGYHLLQFEKSGPANGRIKWDRTEITEEMLVKLLRLDVHPYSPFRPMDEFLRDRHGQNHAPSLFDVDHIKPPFQVGVDSGKNRDNGF